MTPTEFMREYAAVGKNHDLEAILSFIAEDAVFLFSNRSSHFGKDAIRRAIQRNFDIIKNEEYRIEGLTWLASSDDVAACVYEFHWSGEIDGKPAEGHGRGTAVIERIDGEWRMVHEHLSAGDLWRE